MDATFEVGASFTAWKAPFQSGLKLTLALILIFEYIQIAGSRSFKDTALKEAIYVLAHFTLNPLVHNVGFGSGKGQYGTQSIVAHPSRRLAGSRR